MRITSTLFVLLIYSVATAQTTVEKNIISRPASISRMPLADDYNTWDIGASLGLAYPRTDIAGSGGGFGISLQATKFFSHSIALQARFINARLAGKDITKPDYRFNTIINYDLTLNAMLQLGNVSFLKQVPDLAFYLTAGFGMIHYSPQISLNGGRTKLNGIYSQYIQTFDTFDYRGRTDFMLPVCIGGKYRISDKLALTAEYSFRTTNTDKLDGFFKLLSSNDSYSFFNVGIICHLGSNDKVIQWENPIEALYADLDLMRNRLDRSVRDSDGDGVPDLYDKEPETPAGTKVYGNGVSVDTDSDGVPDRIDEELFSPRNAKVDEAGRQIIEKPATVESPVARENVQPVPQQKIDSLAHSPAIVQSSPAVLPEIFPGNELPSVYFGFDSARISKKYYEAIGKIAERIRSNPQHTYRIIGISENVKNYNQNLSLRRAEAVKRHLVKYYKISPGRLICEVQVSTPQETDASGEIYRRVDVKQK